MEIASGMILGIMFFCILFGYILYLLLRLQQEKERTKQRQQRLSRSRRRNKKKEKQIAELEKSVEHLNETAYTDITTKIGNRDFFIKKMLERLDSEKDAGILIGFGITNIGTVNRLYGPAEGDRLVRFAAQLLKQLEFGEGFCALVQSNLFALLLPEKEEGEAIEAVNRITEGIESASDIFTVKVSFGLYRITDKTERVSEMLSRMVLAQRSVQEKSGKNYAWFNEELRQKYEENVRMCQEMEKALDERKFVMYLQPMVDLHIYQIRGAEALVRWEHAEKGLLSPYAFLPAFENTNLMLKLDYYMWEEACRTIRRWIDNKLEPLPLMLNISPIHLSSDAFISVLSGMIERYKLKKEMFVLELPERALTSGGAQMKRMVTALAEGGFTLSVDNFGSMHSPVNLLRELPVRIVKLDRKFLTDNSEDEEGQTILRYLIAMAKELDLTVAVEGVETLEQVNFLTEIGCDMAQGYYFSKPVSLRDFDQLNKKIIRQGFRPTEYYPTFTDLENGEDIIEKMMKR